MKSKALNYTIILTKEAEGGYTVIAPSLPGLVTYGKDVEEAKKMAVEAIELYLESLDAHKEKLPQDNETLYTQVSVNSPLIQA